jgi:excisionase family DNA binding protein
VPKLPDKSMLTTAEVAAILDCTPSNVCKLWNLGKLRGEKLGHRTLRIYRDSVLDHLSVLAEEAVDALGTSRGS